MLSMNNFYAWCSHRLSDHLYNCKVLVADPQRYQYKSRIDVDALEIEIVGVIARLSRVMKIDAKYIRRYLSITAALHDIGKLHPVYQERLISYCPNDKYISLAGHEILSAWMAWHIFDSINDEVVHELGREELKHLKYLSVSSILMHHIGRRSIHEAYHKLKQFMPYIGITLWADTAINIVSNVLVEDGVRIDHEKALSFLEYAHRLPNSVLRLIDGVINNIDSRQAELATYVISLADNIDSYISRNDKLRGIMIERFIK